MKVDGVHFRADRMSARHTRQPALATIAAWTAAHGCHADCTWNWLVGCYRRCGMVPGSCSGSTKTKGEVVTAAHFAVAMRSRECLLSGLCLIAFLFEASGHYFSIAPDVTLVVLQCFSFRQPYSPRESSQKAEGLNYFNLFYFIFLQSSSQYSQQLLNSWITIHSIS